MKNKFVGSLFYPLIVVPIICVLAVGWVCTEISNRIGE